MKTLSLIDNLFLFLENHKQPMHVAGLCLFELPDGAPDDFVHDIYLKLSAQSPQTCNLRPRFPFNQRLVGRFFWRDDDSFELASQVHYYSLTDLDIATNSAQTLNDLLVKDISDEPDDIKKLIAHISHSHAKPLNRHKPLWTLHILDHIPPQTAGGKARFGLWLKMHHALADGVAAMRLLRHSLASTANDTILPFWALDNSPTSLQKNHNTANTLTNKKTTTSRLYSAFTSIPMVARELIRDVHLHLTGRGISTFSTPTSVLNQRISHHRHVSLMSLAKSRFTSTAQMLNVTTNDLLLAVTSGALRAYLLKHNALPTKPLTAFVPISLRQDNSCTGNQLSFVLTNLGTHHTDASERLTTIKRSMDDGKRRFGKLTFGQTILYSICAYGWAGLNLATSTLPRHQAFNLIISNVPSPHDNHYLYDARLIGIYPASVLFDGQALNLTLVNHGERIDIGVTACPTVLPHISDFLHFMEYELAVFEHLAQQVNG